MPSCLSEAAPVMPCAIDHSAPLVTAPRRFRYRRRGRYACPTRGRGSCLAKHLQYPGHSWVLSCVIPAHAVPSRTHTANGVAVTRSQARHPVLRPDTYGTSLLGISTTTGSVFLYADSSGRMSLATCGATCHRECASRDRGARDPTPTPLLLRTCWLMSTIPMSARAVNLLNASSIAGTAVPVSKNASVCGTTWSRTSGRGARWCPPRDSSLCPQPKAPRRTRVDNKVVVPLDCALANTSQQEPCHSVL